MIYIHYCIIKLKSFSTIKSLICTDTFKNYMEEYSFLGYTQGAGEHVLVLAPVSKGGCGVNHIGGI